MPSMHQALGSIPSPVGWGRGVMMGKMRKGKRKERKGRGEKGEGGVEIMKDGDSND